MGIFDILKRGKAESSKDQFSELDLFLAHAALEAGDMQAVNDEITTEQPPSTPRCMPP